MAQDASAMMTSMAECLTIQNSTLNIPYFDGKGVPLKEFVQDVQNSAALVPPASEDSFLKSVLGKLKGSARDSTYGKTFNTVNELIKHLKGRYAPGKNYPYYQHEIENIRMKKEESVSDFYDRLNILISGARVALEDSYGNNAEQMLLPLKECGLEAYIRGLPDEIARSVDARDPKTLDDARKFAVRIETRMKSGILPSNETQKVSFNQNNGYSRSSNSYYQDYANHQSINPPRYKNYAIRNEEENRTRSPSPSPDVSRSPMGILKPQSRNYFYNPSGFPPQPYYPPYFYPPMPYPNYYPYPHYNTNSNGQPYSVRDGYSQMARPRSPSPGPSAPRPVSPYSRNTKTEDSRNDHLNAQMTRRTDAMSSHSDKERHATVKFLANQEKLQR